MKFLNLSKNTALDVSCSNLQAWIVTWRLPTLSFSFHFVLSYLFILSKIFIYVRIDIVVLLIILLFTVYFWAVPCEILEYEARFWSYAFNPWLPNGFHYYIFTFAICKSGDYLRLSYVLTKKFKILLQGVAYTFWSIYS